MVTFGRGLSVNLLDFFAAEIRKDAQYDAAAVVVVVVVVVVAVVNAREVSTSRVCHQRILANTGSRSAAPLLMSSGGL